jgi:hypothetical protein
MMLPPGHWVVFEIRVFIREDRVEGRVGSADPAILAGKVAPRSIPSGQQHESNTILRSIP